MATPGLPLLRFVATPGSAEVTASATRPGDDGAVVVVGGVDDAGVLARDKAKGEAGEVVALPSTERVFLVVPGTAPPARCARRAPRSSVAR